MKEIKKLTLPFFFLSGLAKLVLSSIFAYFFLTYVHSQGVSNDILMLIGLFLGTLIILNFILNIISYQKISKNLEPYPSIIKKEIKIESDEKIKDYIPGIMKLGLRDFKPIWLGTGEIPNSENAFIISNKNIWFIVTPLFGADKMIQGLNVPMWEWLIADKAINNKLQKMIEDMSLQQILQASAQCFALPLKQIKQIEFEDKSQKIIFIINEDKKYTYSIRSIENFEKAQRLVKNLKLHQI